VRSRRTGLSLFPFSFSWVCGGLKQGSTSDENSPVKDVS